MEEEQEGGCRRTRRTGKGKKEKKKQRKKKINFARSLAHPIHFPKKERALQWKEGMEEEASRFVALVAVGFLFGAVVTCLSRAMFGRCILSRQCEDEHELLQHPRQASHRAAKALKRRKQDKAQ